MVIATARRRCVEEVMEPTKFARQNAGLRFNRCLQDFVWCDANGREWRGEQPNQTTCFCTRYFRTGLDCLERSSPRKKLHRWKRPSLGCMLADMPTDCVQHIFQYLTSDQMTILGRTNHVFLKNISINKNGFSPLEGTYSPSLVAPACQAQLEARHSLRSPLTYLEYTWLQEVYSHYDIPFLPWLKIKYLDVRDSNMKTDDLEKIVRIFRNVVGLNMWGNSEITSFSSLMGLVALEDLNLGRCHTLCDLTSLKALTSLQSLNLNQCAKICEIESVAKLTSLRRLIISGTKVADLRPISGLVELESLEMEQCSRLSHQQLVHLKNLKLLQVLTTSIHMTDENLEIIGSLPCVQYLYLSNCSGVTDVGTSCLSKLLQLETLILAQMIHVTKGGIQSLSKLYSLQYLALFGFSFITQNDLISLAWLPALAHLTIGSIGLVQRIDMNQLRALENCLTTREKSRQTV
jgi:hypothetical protein